MKQLDLPLISGGVEQQLSQIRSYIYKQNEYINVYTGGTTAAKMWDASLTAIVNADNPMETQTRRDEYKNLRALIIKSADEVVSNSEEFRRRLSGTYIAKSDFGRYFESATVDIEGTPYGITQLYGYTSDVADEFHTYTTNSENYIKSGLLDNSTASPVYGVEIGLLTDELIIDGQTVHVSDPVYTRITPTAWELWRSGNKIAYTSADNIYFPSAHITGGSISIGEKCTISSTGAATFTDGEFTGVLHSETGQIAGFGMSGGVLYGMHIAISSEDGFVKTWNPGDNSNSLTISSAGLIINKSEDTILSLSYDAGFGGAALLSPEYPFSVQSAEKVMIKQYTDQDCGILWAEYGHVRLQGSHGVEIGCANGIRLYPNCDDVSAAYTGTLPNPELRFTATPDNTCICMISSADLMLNASNATLSIFGNTVTINGHTLSFDGGYVKYV